MEFAQLTDQYLMATNRQIYTLEILAQRKGTSKSDLKRHTNITVDMLVCAQEILPSDWKTRVVPNGKEMYLDNKPLTLVLQYLLAAVAKENFSSNRGIRVAVENRVKHLQGG